MWKTIQMYLSCLKSLEFRVLIVYIFDSDGAMDEENVLTQQLVLHLKDQSMNGSSASWDDYESIELGYAMIMNYEYVLPLFKCESILPMWV